MANDHSTDTSRQENRRRATDQPARDEIEGRVFIVIGIIAVVAAMAALLLYL